MTDRLAAFRILYLFTSSGGALVKLFLLNLLGWLPEHVLFHGVNKSLASARVFATSWRDDCETSEQWRSLATLGHISRSLNAWISGGGAFVTDLINFATFHLLHDIRFSPFFGPHFYGNIYLFMIQMRRPRVTPNEVRSGVFSCTIQLKLGPQKSKQRGTRNKETFFPRQTYNRPGDLETRIRRPLCPMCSNTPSDRSVTARISPKLELFKINILQHPSVAPILISSANSSVASSKYFTSSKILTGNSSLAESTK